MKKLSALLILSMLILSVVPSAFAVEEGSAFAVEEGQGQLSATDSSEVVGENESEVEVENESEVEDDSDLKERIRIRIEESINDSEVRERLRERIEVRSEEFKEIRSELREKAFTALKQRDEYKKFSLDNFKARTVTKDRLELARKNYLKAKSNFEKARDNYKDSRIKYQRARNEFNQCSDEDSDECLEVRSEMRTHTIGYLSYAADMVLEELNKIKAKVQESEDLTDEEVEEAVVDLDEQIAEVEEAKADLDGLDENSDKEDVEAVALKIRNAWKSTKPVLKNAAGRVVNARIGGILVQISQLEVRLEKVLERMEAQGKDTSDLEELIDEFNKDLGEAKLKYEAAVAKFRAGKTASDVDQAVKDGQEAMKDAHKALQEAHKKLKDIFKEIKDQGSSKDLDEVEVDDESEDDSSEQ